MYSSHNCHCKAYEMNTEALISKVLAHQILEVEDKKK